MGRGSLMFDIKFFNAVKSVLCQSGREGQVEDVLLYRCGAVTEVICLPLSVLR